MKERRVRWLLPLLVLALAFSLGIAACGGDDENDGNNAAETAATEVTGGVQGAATEVTEGAQGAATEVSGAAEGAATEVSGAAQGAATEVSGAGGGDEGDALISNALALTGDAANGEALFTSLGCSGCHDVSTGTAGTGPSLQGVSADAAEDVEGMSAEEYLAQSIVHPDAHVAEGFQAGIMPSYADRVDAQQLADLVAYLMTL